MNTKINGVLVVFLTLFWAFSLGSFSLAGPPTTGSNKIAVLLINCQNGTPLYTAAQVEEFMFTGSNSVNQYFKDSSFGQLNFVGYLNPKGDVFGPYTVPQSGFCYDVANDSAKSMAAADGFVDTNYDRIVYAYLSTTITMAGGGLVGDAFVGGKELSVNALHLFLWVHEFEHSLGSNHGGDPWDPMSNSWLGPYQPYGYNKAQFQWLGTNNIVTVSKGGTFSIAPLEWQSSGVQLIAIPRDKDAATGTITRNYYLDVRQPSSWDTFNSTDPAVTGVSIMSAGPIGQSSGGKFISIPNTLTLRAGATYQDPLTGMTISALDISSSGATVSINVGPTMCLRANPTMSLSPSPQAGSPGQSLTYNLTITNNDSAACETLEHNITVMSAFVGSGWTVTGYNFYETVPPGKSITRTFSITSPATASNGCYPIGASVRNQSLGDPSGCPSAFGCYLANAVGYYNINSTCPTSGAGTSTKKGKGHRH